jgi:hypothetical protein
VLKERKETIVDNQELEWLQCVRDYSDGVRGYGGYVIAGPALHLIDQQLRKLGYVVGIPGPHLRQRRHGYWPRSPDRTERR